MIQTADKPQIAPSIQFRSVVDGVRVEHPVHSRFIVFIALFIAENAYPPSIREILKGVGFASNAPVVYQLEVLRSQGILDWTEGRKRSIRFLKDIKLEVVEESDRGKR
jgi:SOS-response transcriptional repressor LexA